MEQKTENTLWKTPDDIPGRVHEILSAASDDKKRRHKADSRCVLQLETGLIDPSPHQPRKYFAEGAIVRLADSIRQYGILQPLSVRGKGDRYELVAGERRLRAAKLCGLSRVPCILLETDDSTASCLSVIENIQRENLNMFEEAEAICRLVGLYGLTQEEVAEKLSCSQSAVANKLRLLRLSPSQRGLILSGGLTERHARALLRLKSETERDEALRQIIARHMNVAATEELVEKLLQEPADPRDPEPRAKGRLILRDVRVFYHSIDRALDLVRRAGIPVESTRAEDGEWTELRIRLPREGRREISAPF